jgi:hypothetical protein
MKLAAPAWALLLLAAPALAPAALAHHSFTMFDLNPAHIVTLKGTVKELEWVNPHSWLHIVTLEQGVPEEWAIEMPSVSVLTSRGWRKDSVQPGDKIVLTAHPLKDGTHGGSEISVTLKDGTILGDRPAAGH